jgi:hypothetical protein
MAKLSSSRQKALLRKYAINVKFFMMLASVTLIVYALPKQAKFGYEYEKGRIWNQKDLISPYNFAILKTNAEIDADLKTALATITPVYQKNDEMRGLQVEGFKSDLEIKWHNAGLNDKQKTTYLQTGIKLLNEAYDTGILKLNPKYQLPGYHFKS